jgi:hypothetical protein
MSGIHDLELLLTELREELARLGRAIDAVPHNRRKTLPYLSRLAERSAVARRIRDTETKIKTLKRGDVPWHHPTHRRPNVPLRSPQAQQHAQRAVDLLIHYLGRVLPQSLLDTDPDFRLEMEEIVESIIAAAVEECR